MQKFSVRKKVKESSRGRRKVQHNERDNGRLTKELSTYGLHAYTYMSRRYVSAHHVMSRVY